MLQDVLHHQNMLDRLFDQASSLEELGEVDEEVRAHLTQYLCVRASGYVESSVKTILREYVNTKTQEPNILNVVDSRLARSMNPRRDVLLSLIGDFSAAWRETIRDELRGELGTSLDSIVINRNSITHGMDVTLSLNDLKGHFENAKRVFEIIDQQCLTTS